MEEKAEKIINWSKLIEKTIGAMRHVLEKHGFKGYMPVGFSVVFYNSEENNPEKKWYYDVRPIIDARSLDLYEAKLRERIVMVNEFLAHGVKKILEGEIDDLMVNKEDIEGIAYQIPGLKGKA